MLIACFCLICRLEEMKLWSLILRAQAWHTRSDDVSDLSICRPISDFWNSWPLESIRGLEKGFCMGIFKFFEWDLEQTTTKSTIIVYSSLDSPFVAIYRENTTSDNFVLIIVSQSALISCVNTIHKTCHRVVKICNRGGNKIYWSSGQVVPRSFAARFRSFAALCLRSNCVNCQATQATVNGDYKPSSNSERTR